MSSNIVLPPANGKKLWRVKRTPSNSNNNTNSNSISTSNECLNNSLKIAAAAAKFTIKRPPLRRPKNKPGKPKDFVFVDLSPIKSEEEEEEEQKHAKSSTRSIEQLPSPTLSNDDTSSIFDSLSSITGFEDFSESSATSSPLEGLGLGIMNLGINFDQPQSINQQSEQQLPQQLPQQVSQQPADFYSQQLFNYQQAMLQQHLQIQQLQQQLLEQQRRNTDPITRPSLTQLQSPFQEPSPSNTKPQTAGQFQFKSYQPKKHSRSTSESCIKKPQSKKIHQRSMSVPMTPLTQQPKQTNQFIPQNAPISMELSDSVSTNCSDVSLDDFMMLNDQIRMNLPNSSSSFTPVSEYSEDEFNKSINQYSNYTCGIDDFLVQQNQLQVKHDEFELNSYIHI